MDDDYPELANRLFAIATAMLEDAVGIATAGQSSRRQSSELADLANRLQEAAREIVTIAGTAVIVARLGNEGRRNGRKQRR